MALRTDKGGKNQALYTNILETYGTREFWWVDLEKQDLGGRGGGEGTGMARRGGPVRERRQKGEK